MDDFKLDDDSLAQSYKQLLDWFTPYQTAVVAFSGGGDSTLVLKAAVAAMSAERVLAVTADSPSLPRSEKKVGATLAEHIGARQVFIETQELSDEEYRANRGDRCYFCKSALYGGIIETLRDSSDFSLTSKTVIVDGTNSDDLSDIRPGLKAAQEAGVRHPFVELGFSKDRVRAVSRFAGLSSWDFPEMACLASRIQIGLDISKSKLMMVERAEEGLRALGLKDFRVRYHELDLGNGTAQRNERCSTQTTLARIELRQEHLLDSCLPEIFERAVRAVRDAGFSYVTLDMEGYRKGGGAQDGE